LLNQAFQLSNKLKDSTNNIKINIRQLFREYTFTGAVIARRNFESWNNKANKAIQWISSIKADQIQIDSKLVQMNPVDSKLVEMNPVDSKLVKIKPIDSKLVEIKPIESVSNPKTCPVLESKQDFVKPENKIKDNRGRPRGVSKVRKRSVSVLKKKPILTGTPNLVNKKDLVKKEEKILKKTINNELPPKIIKMNNNNNENDKKDEKSRLERRKERLEMSFRLIQDNELLPLNNETLKQWNMITYQDMYDAFFN
jgi:hypothetical protein